MPNTIVVGGDSNLEDTNTKFCNDVDDLAGNIRKIFLTCVPAQESTYESKLKDCQSYLEANKNNQLNDDASIDEKNFPWVAGEAEAQDLDMKTAAQNVVDTFDEWKTIGIAIEKNRIKGKRLIEAATTVQEKAAARVQALDALNSIKNSAN